jgi:RimJ/RimL family protein N-acetyltransferase
MGHPYWPLFDLRLRIGDLLLRPLTEADLEPLVEALSDDVELNPDSPVYDGQGTAEARGTITHQDYWRAMGTWSVSSWRLNFGVWSDGVLLGAQELEAHDFSRLRTVDSASFLTAQARGKGFGKAMRTAILALAFDHLGAEFAITSAWHDNLASLGVSRSLGYVDNGQSRHRRGDGVDTMTHLRLTRDAWRARGPYDVEVDSVEPCLSFFGLPPKPAQ